MPRIAVIFVNPVEYHGPHLPLKTDYEISKGLLREMMDRLKKQDSSLDFYRVVELHQGCEPAPGPGSVHTPMKELKRLVIDTCKSILLDKPDLVMFMTFHGAPKHGAAIQAGVDFFKPFGIPAYNPFNWVLRIFRDYEPGLATHLAPLIPDPEFRKSWLQKAGQDFHGGLFETSLLLAVNGSVVLPVYRTLPDCPDRKIALPWRLWMKLLHVLGFKSLAREFNVAVDALGWMAMKPHPGYTGAPRFASAEMGKGFIEIFMKDYERGFWDALKKKTVGPKPVLQWTVHF